MNRQKNKKITIENIVEAVCHFFNIRYDDVFGSSRQKNITRARQIVVYLAKEYLKISYIKIGKKIGNRDHTTAIHSYKKIKDIIDHNESFKKDVEKIWDFALSTSNKNNLEKKSPALNDTYKKEVIEPKNTLNYEPKKALSLKTLSKKNIERQADILDKYKNGLTLKEIGTEFSLTRERIRQIVVNALNANARELIKNGVDLDMELFIQEEKNVHSEAVSKKHNDKKLIIDPTRKGYSIVNKKEKRWSKYYDECRNCGTVSIKHKCHGYCEKCYPKTDLFKELQRSSRLRNVEKWKEREKKYLKDYYKRPEVIAKFKNKTNIKFFGGNREKALIRDNYKCAICGMSQEESIKKYGKDLFVVHINGKQNQNLNNLITRCAKCHSIEMVKIMRQKLRK